MNSILATIDNVPVPTAVCANSLWDNIRGWEVIVAVFIIIGGWAATNIARMHYMVKMAQIHNRVQKPPVKRLPKIPVKRTPKPK